MLVGRLWLAPLDQKNDPRPLSFFPFFFRLLKLAA